MKQADVMLNRMKEQQAKDYQKRLIALECKIGRIAGLVECLADLENDTTAYQQMPSALKAINDMLSITYNEVCALSETFSKLNQLEY